MWRRIELTNYRSIESVRVDIAPFTLIVGPNGSGKSNFVDAFVFARDVGQDAVTAIDSRGGVGSVRRWRRTKPNDVTVDVMLASTREGLGNAIARHSFTIRSEKGGAWRFSREQVESRGHGRDQLRLVRSGKLVTTESTQPRLFPDEREVPNTTSIMVVAKQFAPRLRSLLRVRRYRLNPDEMKAPQVATENHRLDESGRNVAVAVRELMQKVETRDALLAALAGIVPGLVDVRSEPVGRSLLLRFEQRQAGGGRNDFDATEMSEGALRSP